MSIQIEVDPGLRYSVITIGLEATNTTTLARIVTDLARDLGAATVTVDVRGLGGVVADLVQARLGDSPTTTVYARNKPAEATL